MKPLKAVRRFFYKNRKDGSHLVTPNRSDVVDLELTSLNYSSGPEKYKILDSVTDFQHSSDGIITIVRPESGCRNSTKASADQAAELKNQKCCSARRRNACQEYRYCQGLKQSITIIFLV